MAKRSIVVNQKQYFLPDHIDTQAYLDYCDVQDALDSATNYRRKHFEQMAQAVCHGSQVLTSCTFTVKVGRSNRNENAILSSNEMTAFDAKWATLMMRVSGKSARRCSTAFSPSTPGREITALVGAFLRATSKNTSCPR